MTEMREAANKAAAAVLTKEQTEALAKMKGKKFELWDEAVWNERMSGWLNESGEAETPDALLELTL